MTLPEILDETASLRQERRSMWDQERRYIARINELEARANKLEKALRKAQDRIYYAVDWRHEGEDEPLKQAWREIEEALGDAAPSSSEEGEEDGTVWEMNPKCEEAKWDSIGTVDPNSCESLAQRIMKMGGEDGR